MTNEKIVNVTKEFAGILYEYILFLTDEGHKSDDEELEFSLMCIARQTADLLQVLPGFIETVEANEENEGEMK